MRISRLMFTLHRSIQACRGPMIARRSHRACGGSRTDRISAQPIVLGALFKFRGDGLSGINTTTRNQTAAVSLSPSLRQILVLSSLSPHSLSLSKPGFYIVTGIDSAIPASAESFQNGKLYQLSKSLLNFSQFLPVFLASAQLICRSAKASC